MFSTWPRTANCQDNSIFFHEVFHLLYFDHVLTMSEVSKWKKFANDIKLKRTNVGTKQKKTKSGEGKPSAGSKYFGNKEITVQPLATEATGKLKKYERTGPQEFLPFLFEEVTIENTILSCNISRIG